jgi:hypothetical protein
MVESWDLRKGFPSIDNQLAMDRRAYEYEMMYRQSGVSREVIRFVEDVSRDNADLKCMVLRQIDEIKCLKSRVDSIDKKLSEIHEWEETNYEQIRPIYDWFCAHDLRNLQPNDIVADVIDTIELERKADLERKKERNSNAVKNQARTARNISDPNREGKDLQGPSGPGF